MKRAARVILLTGFEPFGGDASNPSQAISHALGGVRVGTARVVSRLLPVDGSEAPDLLRRALDEIAPLAVVMLGLASGRFQVALERVAVNALEYRIPDNAGRVRHGERVERHGPDAYLSTLPIPAILGAWREARVPGYVSDSAGTYLCNQVFYAARHHLEHTGRASVPAGFIHVPCDETLALEKRQPYVPLDHQIRAVRVALEVIAVGRSKTEGREASQAA